MMKLIPNWAEQKNTCWVCGTKKSVKYKMNVIVTDPISAETEREVCTCNRCVLFFSEEQ